LPGSPKQQPRRSAVVKYVCMPIDEESPEQAA